MNMKHLYGDMLADANATIDRLTRDKALLTMRCRVAVAALEAVGAQANADSIRFTLELLEKCDANRLASLDQAREEVRSLRADPLADNRFEVLPTNPSPEAPVGTAKGLGLAGKFSALFKRQAE